MPDREPAAGGGGRWGYAAAMVAGYVIGGIIASAILGFDLAALVGVVIGGAIGVGIAMVLDRR